MRSPVSESHLVQSLESLLLVDLAEDVKSTGRSLDLVYSVSLPFCLLGFLEFGLQADLGQDIGEGDLRNIRNLCQWCLDSRSLGILTIVAMVFDIAPRMNALRGVILLSPRTKGLSRSKDP